jgi:hypothetical protein
LSILARVLMLAACVPLLQPTGFCVCKSGAWGPTAACRQKAVPSQDTDQKLLKHAGCCSHRNHINDAGHSPVPHPGERAPDPCPSPGDDSHLPGCPASAGVDRYKWVERTLSHAQMFSLIEIAAVRPLEVPAFSTSLAVTTAASYPAGPPLYLSHCVLVI